MGKLTSKPRDRKGKKTVAIVGMANTSRDHAPYADKNVEIWSLNEAHAHNYLKRLDRVFQMHPVWDYMRAGNFNDPWYSEWLLNQEWTEEDLEKISKANLYDIGKRPKGFPEYIVGNKRRPDDLPIYTLEIDENVSGSTIYPLKQIVDLWGPHARYFTCTFSYMMAFALLPEEHGGFGADRVEAYGWEMSSQEEYAFQKANAEYWIGRCEGMGKDFFIPAGCHLLGELEKLYGYEKVPGYTKMHAEIRKNELARIRGKKQAILNNIQGQKKNIVDNFGVAQQKKDNAWVQKLQNQLIKTQQAEIKGIAELNAIHGAFQEAEKVWKDLQALPSADEVKTILPKAMEDNPMKESE